MNMRKKLYPNGFLFTKNKNSSVPIHYKKINVNKVFKFYYDPVYKLNFYEENDNFIIISGHFKHVNLNNSYSNEDLLPVLLKNYINNYQEFLDLLDYIGGRYCIIANFNNNIEVFQDATGARSVYYSLDEDIISSHVNLIKENSTVIPWENYGDSTYPYYSFDNSPYVNVKALVPNFKLDLNRKVAFRFFPRSHNKYNNINESKKIKIVEVLWKKQLEYYYKTYGNILISLTGGNDSRVSLALSKEYKDILQYFTYCKTPKYFDSNIKSDMVYNNDRLIVEKILKDITINHKFLYYDNKNLYLSEQQKNLLNKNSIISHGRFLLSLYLKYFPADNIMHLRGTCLEIIQSVYVKKEKLQNNKESVLKTYLKSAKKFNQFTDQDTFEKIGLDGIESLGYGKNHYDYEVLDLYYWEHRMGRWHPELLNETDLAFDTFLPFNLRAILDIGMSFSFKKRKSGYLFAELINNNFSILNFYGINNLNNLYEQNRISKNKENENPLVNNFNIYNNVKKENLIVNCKDNTLKIPKEQLLEKNFSYFEYYFKSSKGILNLILLSPYKKLNAENYIKYQIYLNEKKILEEDISKWNYDNNINIFNLSRNDKVTVKVLTLKTIQYSSWENASQIKIRQISEIENHDSTNIDKNCTATSPFSIIF